MVRKGRGSEGSEEIWLVVSLFGRVTFYVCAWPFSTPPNLNGSTTIDWYNADGTYGRTTIYSN